MPSVLFALSKIFLIYGLTVVLLAGAGGAASRTRRDYELENYRKCTCPKGQYVFLPCNLTYQVVCRSCPDGTYNTARGYQRSCEPCSSVCPRGEDEVQVKNCTATKDIRCQCKKGTYLRSRTDSYCTEHKRCRPGHGVKRKGNHVRNTRCQRCRVGTYSPKASAASKCKKWTDCKAKNRTIKQQGNRRRDRVCGDFSMKPRQDSELTTSTSETEIIPTAADNDIQETTIPQPMCPLDGDKESDNGTLQCPINSGSEDGKDDINVVGPAEEGDTQTVTPSGGDSNTDWGQRRLGKSTPNPQHILSTKVTPTRKRYWFASTRPAKSTPRTNIQSRDEQNQRQDRENPEPLTDISQQVGSETKTQITHTTSMLPSGTGTTIASPSDLSPATLTSSSTKLLETENTSQNNTQSGAGGENSSSQRGVPTPIQGTMETDLKDVNVNTYTKDLLVTESSESGSVDHQTVPTISQDLFPTPHSGKEGIGDLKSMLKWVLSLVCIPSVMAALGIGAFYCWKFIKKKRSKRYEPECVKQPLLQKNPALQGALDKIGNRLSYDEVWKLMRILLEKVGITDPSVNHVCVEDLKNKVGSQAPARELLTEGMNLWIGKGGGSVSDLIEALQERSRNDLVYLLQDLQTPESNDEVSLSTVSTTTV